jgi:hypothetical protein
LSVARTLDPPDPSLWRTRAQRFWNVHDLNAGAAALELAARDEALLAELEIAFCAGAWIACIALAWALVEGVERRRIAIGDEAAPFSDIDWLREQRNLCLHDAREPPPEASLQEIAEGALRVAFRALYESAWR